MCRWKVSKYILCTSILMLPSVVTFIVLTKSARFKWRYTYAAIYYTIKEKLQYLNINRSFFLNMIYVHIFLMLGLSQKKSNKIALHLLRLDSSFNLILPITYQFGDSFCFCILQILYFTGTNPSQIVIRWTSKTTLQTLTILIKTVWLILIKL